MGNILLGFSIGNIEGIEYVFNYLIIYMLISINIFTIFLTFYNNKYFINNIVDFILILKSNKYLAIFFVLSLFSLGGIPPLAGFFAKLPIFFLLIKYINPLLGIIIILTSVISIIYYIRLIRFCFFSEIVGENPIFFINNLTYNQSIIITFITFFNCSFI
jgi:NADH-quinone oxidoreductase subunit N